MERRVLQIPREVLLCPRMYELLWSPPSFSMQRPAIISSPGEAGLNRTPRVVVVETTGHAAQLSASLGLAYLAVTCGVTCYKLCWLRESQTVSKAVLTLALQMAVAGYPL